MKLGGNLPLGHDALLFSISGTGSFLCPVTDTPRPYQPRPLITDSSGHTKAFDYCHGGGVVGSNSPTT